MKNLSRILLASPCRPQRARTSVNWGAGLQYAVFSWHTYREGGCLGTIYLTIYMIILTLAVLKGQLNGKKCVNTTGHCCQGDARKRLCWSFPPDLNSLCGDICSCPDSSCATCVCCCHLHVSHCLYPPGVDDKVSHFGLFLFLGFHRKKLSRNWTSSDTDQTDHSSTASFDLHIVALGATFWQMRAMIHAPNGWAGVNSNGSVKFNKLPIPWRKTKG